MNEQNGKNILERCDYLIINNLNFKQMKKKIFSVVAAVAVVAAAGWSYQQSKYLKNDMGNINIKFIIKQ